MKVGSAFQQGGESGTRAVFPADRSRCVRLECGRRVLDVFADCARTEGMNLVKLDVGAELLRFLAVPDALRAVVVDVSQRVLGPSAWPGAPVGLHHHPIPWMTAIP